MTQPQVQRVSSFSQKISRRSVLVQAPAALALPIFTIGAGRVFANDNNAPNDPNLPGGASVRPNPHHFPEETRDQTMLWEAYGDPRASTELVKVAAPYLLKISFLPGEHRSFLWAHRKVADSLGSVLERVKNHYGLDEVDRLGLNVFGGDHVDRQMTGAARWSMHAWAIAYDFDPDNNAYRMSRNRARFAHPAYDDWWRFWREEGWFALGPELDFDFMHVQAAIRTY
jgi:hypothetical protein